MKWGIVFCVFSLLSIKGYSQSTTVRRTIDQVSRWKVYFLYPSTIRMINVDQNPEFYDLISEIENIKVIKLTQEEMKKYKVDSLEISNQLKSESFQEIMSLHTNQRKIRMLGKYEQIANPTIVALVMQGEEGFLFIEIVGEIDLAAAVKLLQKGYDFTGWDSIMELNQPAN